MFRSPNQDIFSSEEIVRLAGAHGFPLVGIVSSQDAPGFERFEQWLERGYGDGMSYLGDRKEAYRHPNGVMPGTRSVVMLAMPYQPAPSLRKTQSNSAAEVGLGRVAAYASGSCDYHDLIHSRLKLIVSELKSKRPSLQARGIVDSAPLLERDFAALAGLGWIGKNTLLLNRSHGSYFFLAAILVDCEITGISNFTPTTDHCGTCTACLDACPTNAFPEPRVLDARRCISYLTIEHRGPVPLDLREGIGDHLFGCDICQQVCPWNRMAQPTNEPELMTIDTMKAIDLIELLDMDEYAFRIRFRRTPMWRAKRVGMIRNALIVVGNQGFREAKKKVASLLTDEDATIRATAEWALRRIEEEQQRKSLLH